MHKDLKDMKRVLHVFANLNQGGAESRIIDVYRYIDKKKYQFDFLILTNESCFFEKEVIALGGEIYRVTHPSINIYKHIKEVIYILKKNKFSAVHSHTSYFSGLILLIAWFYKIPYRIAHARNQFIGTNNIMVKPFFLIGKQLCNSFATSKLSISKEAGYFLFGKKNNFLVVPNAFEYKKIKFQRSINGIGLCKKTLNLVMVARLVPVKNHIFAIMLVNKINQSNNNKVKLYLIGSGTEEEKISNLVKKLDLQDSVIFLGRRSDVYDILCEFDCLILPSYSEGLGVAALEAQAAGLPCFLSEGVPEEADLKLGLVKRLPLDLDLWKNAIFDFKPNQLLNKEIIDEIFQERGYSIEKTSEIYLSKYGFNL